MKAKDKKTKMVSKVDLKKVMQKDKKDDMKMINSAMRKKKK